MKRRPPTPPARTHGRGSAAVVDRVEQQRGPPTSKRRVPMGGAVEGGRCGGAHQRLRHEIHLPTPAPPPQARRRAGGGGRAHGSRRRGDREPSPVAWPTTAARRRDRHLPAAGGLPAYQRPDEGVYTHCTSPSRRGLCSRHPPGAPPFPLAPPPPHTRRASNLV